MSKALIVTDIQYDFLLGGSLAVVHGDRIIDGVNELIDCFDQVVVTQDWHPENHVSFAVNHPGKELFSTVQTDNGVQILWPAHCVQGTKGALVESRIHTDKACCIIRKGMHTNCDSYSAFMEADRKTKTGLDGFLYARGVTEVYVTGLAMDFCVSWTALDAARFGFKSYVVTDASAAIDVNGSLAAAKNDWQQAGVSEITVAEVLASF